MTKRWLSLLIVGLMFFSSFSAVVAADRSDLIAEIKTKAESDKYRFVLVDEKGITEKIRRDLAENDETYLKDQPIGSVSIQVMDAQTGQPVENADIFLSFSTNRSSVNVDGSKDQIANPFLLFDIGKTDKNGERVYKETYFYNTRKIDPNEKPFHDTLSVQLATVDDQDPELTVTGAKNYIQTSDPDTFKAIVDKIGGRTTLKLSEFKFIISQTANPKYNEVFRNLFQDAFVVYSDRVNVRVPDAPQYQKLIDSGKQVLPFGELQTYLQENRDLFVRFVAARYYDDFAGFEPNFRIRHEAGYDSVTTYKDGSKVASSGTNYVRIQIFDKVQGGTGHAVYSSSFSYRAYVYAEGYQSGRAIGSVIRQDYVDKDVIYRVYLSKDAPPASAVDKSNILTGTLVNAKGEPITSASIQIVNTTHKTTTDPEGRFIFSTLKNETVKLSIIDPENGKPMIAKAVFEGKEYPIDQIPIKLAGKNEIHQVSLIGGVAASTTPRTTNPAATTQPGGGTSKADNEKDGKGLLESGLLWIAGLLLLVIIILMVILLARKKKKNVCRQCGAKLEQEMKFCTRCGTPRGN